jgi:hypothetical protein
MILLTSKMYISIGYRDRADSVRHSLDKYRVICCAEGAHVILTLKFYEACGVSREARHNDIDIEKVEKHL